MPTRYKSVGNAIKRGHLRVNTKEVQDGWDSDVITGIIAPKMVKLPFIERKTNRGNWIPYKF